MIILKNTFILMTLLVNLYKCLVILRGMQIRGISQSTLVRYTTNTKYKLNKINNESIIMKSK